MARNLNTAEISGSERGGKGLEVVNGGQRFFFLMKYMYNTFNIVNGKNT